MHSHKIRIKNNKKNGCKIICRSLSEWKWRECICSWEWRVGGGGNMCSHPLPPPPHRNVSQLREKMHGKEEGGGEWPSRNDVPTCIYWPNIFGGNWAPMAQLHEVMDTSWDYNGLAYHRESNFNHVSIYHIHFVFDMCPTLLAKAICNFKINLKFERSTWINQELII